MIDEENPYRKMWDLFTVCLSVINVTLIPFTMSFGKFADNHQLINAIEEIIDLMFLIDILVMFFTTTTNKHGHRIDTLQGIAKNYISKSRFYFDVLALLGTYPFVALWRNFKYFQLFKILRVFRMSELIAKSNVSMEMKAALNLFKIVFYMMMYLHILACLWFVVVLSNSPEIYNRTFDGAYVSPDNRFFVESEAQQELGVSTDPVYDALFG